MQSDFFETAARIDLLTEKYTAQNLDAIEMLFDQEGMLDYFIRRITSSHSVDWLVPLEQRGYFDPSRNPSPEEIRGKSGSFVIPYWSVLSYLEVLSKENTLNPNGQITNALLEIIDRIIHYRDENGFRIDNYHTDRTVITVLSNLPTLLITEEHIEFIRDSLHSKFSTGLVAADIGKDFIPKLIEAKRTDLLILLVDVILEYKLSDDNSGDRYLPVMDAYWLAETLEKHKRKIAELCGLEAAHKALGKMKRILAEDNNEFDNYLISTIEDSPQILFPQRYECQVVQFVRDMYEFYPDPPMIRDDIETLLSEEHPIFKRLAFYIINKRFDALEDLFFEAKGNPIGTFVMHELYELLKEHWKEFSEDQIVKILDWIETEPLPEEISKDKRHVAKIRKGWLHALSGSGDKKVIERYHHYSSIFPHELHHPGYYHWMESGKVKEKTPISAEELSKKSNQEIAQYLKEFRDEGKFVWGEFSEVSLTNTLKQAVTTDPKKFSTDLDHFLGIPPLYIVRILWGLTEAWRIGRDFEWGELLLFIWQIVEPEAFWSGRYEEGKENQRTSIIKAIAALISEGTENDEHAFNLDLLPDTKRILLLLLGRAESDLGGLANIVTSALSSTKGHIYEALVNYSLRYARIYKKTDKHRWEVEVKSEFTKRLDRSAEGTPEFSVILGKYLANLFYLDEEWVRNHVHEIFPKNDPMHWKAGMSGYLYYANKVYEEIYNLLKLSGDLEKAIYTEFDDKFATERLVQHISIRFLWGKESLDDPSSLVSNLLGNSAPEQLGELASFLWTQRGNLRPEQIQRVQQLWGKIMEVVDDKLEDPAYHPFASNLIRWLALVDKIDEDILRWVKRLAKYLEKDRFNIFIIEDLLRHVDKTPKKVAEIYIEMLSNEVYPLYKKEHIRDLLGRLYTTCPDLADRICNIYGEKGFVEIVEDVYREHHRIEPTNYSNETKGEPTPKE